DARLHAAWSLEILSRPRLASDPRKDFLAAPPAWRRKWLAEIVRLRPPGRVPLLLVVASKCRDVRWLRVESTYNLSAFISSASINFEPKRVARTGPDCIFLTPRLAVLATKNQRPP